MDTRTLSRAFGAFALVGGAAAETVETYIGPVGDNDSPSAVIAHVQAHMGAMDAITYLDLAGMLIVPAMLYLMWLAKPGSPRLAITGGAISFAAMLAAVSGFDGIDVVYYHVVKLGDHASALALVTALSKDPVLGVETLLFVVGHLLGLLLLGIALWRSRAVPVWAAVLVGLAPIAHLAVHTAGAVPDTFTWALFTLGMIGCAVSLLRTPNEIWEPRPVATVEAVTPRQPVPAA